MLAFLLEATLGLSYLIFLGGLAFAGWGKRFDDWIWPAFGIVVPPLGGILGIVMLLLYPQWDRDSKAKMIIAASTSQEFIESLASQTSTGTNEALTIWNGMNAVDKTNFINQNISEIRDYAISNLPSQLDRNGNLVLDILPWLTRKLSVTRGNIAPTVK